jgi:uncharacterized protein HemX
MSEQHVPTKQINADKPSKKSHWGLLLGLLVIVILLGMGYYYFRQHHTKYATLQTTNTRLAQQNQQRIEQLSAQQQQILTAQQQLLTQLQQHAKGNSSEAAILENVIFLIQRADLQLQIEHNVGNAIKLLQVAADSVANINSYQLNKVAEALASDIHRLQKISQIDFDQLNTQLQTGNHLVDQLSLQLAEQLQNDTADKTVYTGWQKIWHTFLHALSKVIVVHKVDKEFQPVMNQNDLSSLKLFLHTLLQQAFWGAVNHDDMIYHANLSQAVVMLHLTFPSNNKVAEQLTQLIAELQQLTVQPSLPQQLPSLAIAENVQQQLLQPQSEVKS